MNTALFLPRRPHLIQFYSSKLRISRPLKRQKGNPLTYTSLVKWGMSRKRREKNLSIKAGQPGFLVSYLRPSSPVCWTLISIEGVGRSGRKMPTAHRDWAKVTRAQATLPGI